MIQNSRTMPDKSCAEQGGKVSVIDVLISKLYLALLSKKTACSPAEIWRQPWIPLHLLLPQL
uniref:Uncharacterized protein n=1 Tax=Arundo donax TaxID=35708 RepID=A0A0A9A2E0_ARUDO